MQRIKVIFISSKDRRELFNLYKNNQCPKEYFYGYFEIPSTIFDPYYAHEWFEKYRTLSRLWNVPHYFLARKIHIGFGLGQVICLREKINHTDLVFSTSDSVGLPALLLKRAGYIKKPIIYSSIGLLENLSRESVRGYLKFFKALFKNVEKIICHGYEEYKELCEFLGPPYERVEFLPFGTDVDFFKPQYEDRINNNNDGFVLSLGYDMMRDWRLFLKAVEDLPIPIKLYCHGINLKNMKISRNVEVCSPIPIYELRKKYGEARFIVLPVRENNYTAGSVTLLQSMAMGKAVIVSQTGAIRGGYDLRHEKNCLLVKPGNLEELRESIIYLWKNPEKSMLLGMAARKTVEQNYTSMLLAERLASIFREVYEHNKSKY